MNNKYYIAIAAIIVLLIALYALTSKREANPTPTSADNAPPGSIHNLPVPEAVSKVRALVAERIKVDQGLIIVMSAFEKEWSDSCLGLGGPAESCAAVVTPGYEVTVQAQGREYVYRTNQDGSEIREAK
ncbi:hypothetical protein KW785_01195 [Candidatus Parcubacteria bacterium]|nr:hypothetical protein [Candidatus Parcubacteria bacterium]